MQHGREYFDVLVDREGAARRLPQFILLDKTFLLGLLYSEIS